MIPYNPTLVLKDSYVGIYRIYILRNPITSEVFYVGQTMQELVTRLSGHISETGANREKIHYIKEILDAGHKPIIESVEIIKTTCYIDKEMVNARELYWIKYYKELGCNLLNKMGIDTDGTSREYSVYLSSLKRGETSWHYYYCGETFGGAKVYDEKKLNENGFRLPPPKPPEKQVEVKKEITRFLYDQHNDTVSIMKDFHWQDYVRPMKTIKTEIFPTQPSWSKEFLKDMDWDSEFIDEQDDWSDPDIEEEPDLEPDHEEWDGCDYEPDNDEEFDFLPNDMGIKMCKHIVDYFYRADFAITEETPTEEWNASIVPYDNNPNIDRL